MLKFCPNCNNLLVKSTAGNVLKFICKTCSHSEESKASDSLMLDISLTEEESLYKNEIYLNLAAKDHVAPLVERECGNCGSEVVRDLTIMSSGESIFVCPSCEHRFI
jgi:DNA-directed RNA polymerase subunit M/transcription elongation factor TFIIS